MVLPSSSASSTGSPCAACKFLRRRCTTECVFAPYFPPDQPQRFANVHKIFGASNVTKLLNEVAPHQREDAVNSLAYEAEARVKDPIYGCVGAISLLQQKIAQLQAELAMARSELSRYAGTSIPLPGVGHHHHQSHLAPSPLAIDPGTSAPSVAARDQRFFATREQMIEYARASAALVGLSEEHYQPVQEAGSTIASAAAAPHTFKMEPP